MSITDKILVEIRSLPRSRIREVFDFVEFLKLREEWQTTQEILIDKKLMRSIKKGIDDIRAGRVKEWEEVR